MEVKKIVEGMTAPEVAKVIDDNFKAQNEILETDIKKQNNVIGVSEYKDFSESEAVSVGELRLKDGYLYECIEETTGEWDAAKWKSSSFKKETEKKLSELGSEIMATVFPYYGFVDPTTGQLGNSGINENLFVNTGFLKIDINEKIVFRGNSSNKYNNVISFYDTDKIYISGLSNISENDAINTIESKNIPLGTKFIIVTARAESSNAFVSYAPYKPLQFDYVVDIPVGKNLYNINNSYNELKNDSLYDLVTAVKRDINEHMLTISQRQSTYFLRVYFYNKDYELISSKTDWLSGSVEIPDSCAFIRFRDYGNALNLGGTMVNYGEEILPFEEYKSILCTNHKNDVIKFNRFFNTESTSLTTGSLGIDVPNVKYSQTIGFYAKINTFNKITLSHGKTTWAAGMVDIDNTSITTYNSIPQVVETIPHGLNINTFIEVLISQIDTEKAKLYIRTLGGEFVKDIPFNGSRDNVLIESVECDLMGCKLTFSCKDFDKDIWAFGDSYFDYIPTKLADIGYNNALFDAYSGRSSSIAMESLKKMLGINGRPKIIYWAMGMNDLDSESSINANWLNAYNELKYICLIYNIELILATIPNVPNRDNSLKNELIMNSGYRYVDNNKIVGADIDNTWYEGLLSSDNLHPSDEGADVLAKCLAISIPELKK